MYNSKAYSAASATSPLASTKINRREPTDDDVQIEILYCGICHSDLHQVRNEWSSTMPTVYPIVPGHEIVGRVTKVGSAVRKLEVGHDQFCPNMTLNFNSPDRHIGGVTYGGYSDSIVVDERFCPARPV
jgi:alcohol dehydrogenase (NADP+)